MDIADKLIEKLLSAGQLLELKETNSIESYSHIKNILRNQRIPIEYIKYKPFRLARYRRHKPNEIFFDSSEQLSYRKDILNIKNFGRANEPGQGFFYCNDNENADVGVAEIVSVFRGYPNSCEEILTTSAWYLSDSLILAQILPIEEHKGFNKELDSTKEKINVFEETKEFEGLKKFKEFIAKEFTIDLNLQSSNYKITSAFSNYIKESFNVDGIMYASVKAEFKGTNIVLWPETIEKKVKFHSARKSIYKRIYDKTFVEVQFFDCKNYNEKDDKIEW